MKELLEICKVDAEVLSRVERGESVDFLAIEVKISCNVKSVSLKTVEIRCPRKEEELRSSSKSLSFEQTKTKGLSSIERLGY